MRSPVNPCLTCGNRCTTSSGTPSDTPEGYVVQRRSRIPVIGGLKAGRSEELPGPRPEGRAAYAARGWVIEHEKPVAPWGIRPRSHCFSSRPHALDVSAAGDLRVSRATPPSPVRTSVATRVGQSVDTSTTRCERPLEWNRVEFTFLFDYETNRLPTQLPAGARRDRERQQHDDS